MGVGYDPQLESHTNSQSKMGVVYDPRRKSIEALGRETERVLGFKMRRFGHSDDHPERITIRVDYRCSPSAAFTQDTRLSTEIQYCTGITHVVPMNWYHRAPDIETIPTRYCSPIQELIHRSTGQ